MMEDLASMPAPEAKAGAWPSRHGAERAAWARDAVWTGGALLSLALASGCSLTVDPMRPQCKQNSDCEGVYGSGQALCQDNYCIPTTCKTTADCGGNAICNTATESCVAPEQATCRDDSNCVNYEGNPVCKDDGLCGSECTVDSECTGNDSPTYGCYAGKCEDQLWGCVDGPDGRRIEGETAGFSIPILNEITREAIKGLRLRVCDLAHYDESCTKQVGQATYDESMKLATVVGLQPDSPRWRLAIDPPETPGGAMLVPIDYHTERPIREVQERRPEISFVDVELVRRLNVNNGTSVADPRKASVLARMFNCQGTPAEGVSFKLADTPRPPMDSFGFYLGDEGLPDAFETATDRSGRFSQVNIDHTQTYTIEAYVGTKLVSNFRFRPLPGRLTYVDMYPRRRGR